MIHMRSHAVEMSRFYFGGDLFLQLHSDNSYLPTVSI